MTLATLALRGVATLNHLDVAAKYGIRAIRGDAGRAARRGEGPRRLRFGVWHIPVAVAIGMLVSFFLQLLRSDDRHGLTEAMSVAGRPGPGVQRRR